MEVLSKEKIKPSSTTPHHLQKVNLSKLDQLAPLTYVGLIFFYESPKHTLDPSQISQNLKQSLSDVLTIFHPLAGRINQENSCIHCNDDGVMFVETQVRSHMSEATGNPDLTQLFKYVPLSVANNPGEIPLCIQVNFFDCGGVAISVCISHKIADIKSLISFMNAWAFTCRNEVEKQPPLFDLSSHFPPLDLSRFFSEQAPPPESITGVNYMFTKRFVFDKDMLFVLKKHGVSSQVTNPSKMEALTAFLWKNFIISSKEGDLERSKQTKFAAMHAVNVRSRANPPISEETFGNACTQAIAWSKLSERNEQESSYPILIAKLRDAIKKINGDYVGGMRSNGDGEKFDDEFSEKGVMKICIFSSWCRFPMYDVNYGWGEPLWVSTYPVPHKNLTVFIDTKSGDGVEAWVTMAEAEMAVLEKNYKHLLSNANLDDEIMI